MHILKTKYAFHALLWLLKPQLVMDVGSMDGSDSRRFRRLLRQAELVAFEADPDNYSCMMRDERNESSRIRIVNKLASGNGGSHSFYVQEDKARPKCNRGIGSALQRADSGGREVTVEAVRLDDFIENEYAQASRVALWVDVEGFAFEVLSGIARTTDRIFLIHVELETKQVWGGQKLESEVIQLLAEKGYVPLARGLGEVQRDVIFLRRDWYEENRGKVKWLLAICKFAGPTLSRLLECRPR